MLTRPLPAGQFAAFGSSDGKADRGRIRMTATRSYRIPTGGPIGEGLGSIRDSAPAGSLG